ncbi:SRPBCC family protein [Phyllobacterium zundukense]|uniref:Polyketide cyclase n=1 Tax=Phyllobacterium zundukense TaxID=1867719 RepID=A0A2N9VTD0_9HYPH|nr:SRPBCC family protein [Phyllobacterium zundukense]ATU93299.1 polyketide cyclase [Phyllobacterium zundukense]PIO42748.1 polyketide cyclase [Phyllobacterium zundukense]
MTQRSVLHNTFILDRVYAAPCARVFAAWANPEAKAHWFVGSDGWRRSQYQLDFRVGGKEINRGAVKGGAICTYEALYQDIVPDQRIVYTYDMFMKNRRLSVSLTTVEFRPDRKGTRLILTEHGAYLDGEDKPKFRERGTNALLDRLGVALRQH